MDDSSQSERREDSAAALPPRGAKQRKHPGHRYIHVLVPERTYHHVTAQAALSGLGLPDYVAMFLKEAWPYPGPASPLTQEQAPAQ